MTTPVDRRAARVLLVDAADRVLLFRGADPHDPDAGTWWFTPGGGLRPGEGVVDGAVRELFEETGLRCAAAELGEPVHVEQAVFTFASTTLAQHSTFFVLRVQGHEVDTSGFEELEASAILEHRWWSRDELRATTEVVYPGGLADLLERVA
jgi:8-oxo-dGTP pyrophosphatase MutT (NUDIX family)